jgi:hypothetical protein
MTNKDCTVFTLGFIAGAAVIAASVPSFRREAKQQVDQTLAASKDKLSHAADAFKSGIEAQKRAVSASVEAARSTYNNELKSATATV